MAVSALCRAYVHSHMAPGAGSIVSGRVRNLFECKSGVSGVMLMAVAALAVLPRVMALRAIKGRNVFSVRKYDLISVQRYCAEGDCFRHRRRRPRRRVWRAGRLATVAPEMAQTA